MSKITPTPVLGFGIGPSGPVAVPVIENNTDTVLPTILGSVSASLTYAYNVVTNKWERVESAAANNDGLLATGNGNVLTVAQGYGWNPLSNTWDRVYLNANLFDNVAPSITGNLSTNSQLYGYDGTNFDRIRIATVFKNIVATAAGNTAVWTPAAGKSFRLMGYTISVAGTLAATGVNTIQLRDSATVIKTHLANLIQTPSASISGGDTQIGADLGQGQLSAVANNVLNVNLSTAMGSGGVAVNAWGTEE